MPSQPRKDLKPSPAIFPAPPRKKTPSPAPPTPTEPSAPSGTDDQRKDYLLRSASSTSLALSRTLSDSTRAAGSHPANAAAGPAGAGDQQKRQPRKLTKMPRGSPAPPSEPEGRGSSDLDASQRSHSDTAVDKAGLDSGSASSSSGVRRVLTKKSAVLELPPPPPPPKDDEPGPPKEQPRTWL